MNFEIIKENGDGGCIATFEMDTNPFKVGETIYLDINNVDPSFWTLEDQQVMHLGEFKIKEITHYMRQHYGFEKPDTFERRNFTMYTVSLEVEVINLGRK